MSSSMSALPLPSFVAAAPDTSEIVPPVPETIEEAGISTALVEQIILKMLFYRGEILGRDLASALGFKFSLIEEIMETMKRQHMVQVKRSLGMGNTSALFALSENGRNSAREFLEVNQYVGPAPVPLFQYSILVRKQRRRDGWLSQSGPAVSSGNSFLIYGQPGNGKTFLAEALINIDESTVYIPHAIECQGQVIQVFDPVYHQRVDDGVESSVFTSDPTYDKRFVKCRRPFIVTGGELSLEMLDLSFNPVSKIYDAPFQVKANNGVYLIDDFGRQKATPAEILNRWIVPMERRIDYLSFISGGKMTVPFEAFLIFSTNLKPENLGDEAFLRRIQYKMLMRNPDENEFRQIFEGFCRGKELACPPELVSKFIEKHYRKTGKPFRRCHPRDVLSHAIDFIHFEKRPFQLTEELADRAFESTFLQESDE